MAGLKSSHLYSHSMTVLPSNFGRFNSAEIVGMSVMPVPKIVEPLNLLLSLPR